MVRSKRRSKSSDRSSNGRAPRASGSGSNETLALLNELATSQQTIASQYHALEDLHQRILSLERELAAERHAQAVLRADLDSRGSNGRAGRGGQDSFWRLLRRVFHTLPLRDEARHRLKDGFYNVYGKLRPGSFRYRTYQAVQASRAAEQHIDQVAQPIVPRRTSPGSRTWDVLVFPIIDWNFRHQRPQHIALQLAQRGHRVFYFETRFASDAVLYDPTPRRVAENVWVLALPCHGTPPVIYEQTLRPDQLEAVLHGLRVIGSKFALGPTVSLVNHPFWLPVAEALPNNKLVYDCMDHHGGFHNTATFVSEYEQRLFSDADVVLVSSAPLADNIAGKVSRHVLLRNGTEYEHFATPPDSLAITKTRPIVGYYGAVAQWFDTELLAEVALRLHQYDFYVVGDCTHADVTSLRTVPNIHLTGEVTYGELPRYLHAFDVCLVPFRLVELTRCTNPVKVYEYLSAGKPVVATPLPEVELMAPIAVTAKGAERFAEAIETALQDSSAAAQERRREFARANTWDVRGQRLYSELEQLYPKVSVIVLTYNGKQFTEACLDSLLKFTDYPNWELIIVDNASQDGTPGYLQHFAHDKDWVRVILNEQNLGFSAGNNVGAKAASGEYLVFLNNDTYVTQGWLGDLLAHFRRHPMTGAVGPVTNNIGNEAKLDIAYKTIDDMHRCARNHTRRHRRESVEIPVLAFFCIAIPRAVWELIGPLDERFGRGFFEDDDYAMRLRQHGYALRCAEDTFVHHHLSASFGELPDKQRQELFLHNKKLWEAKWGPWKPHRYRQRQSAGAN